MRKRTGGIIFIVVAITFIGFYEAIPEFRGFVDANSTVFAVLGILVTIFASWYFLPGEIKKIQEKTLERRVNTILSPISRLCLGREKELSQLEKDLTHKNVLLIKGIPGIGKTTLGLKFRDRLEEEGYKTFWYQCDSESYEGLLVSLAGHLKGCGSVSAANLMDQEITPKERLKIAVQELCTYPTVLFLDNFQIFKGDSDFKIFTDYLKNSHLVIMSRTQPTFLSESYESLKYLDRKASLDLLKTLNLEEPQGVLERIYEKTQGHPWSLVRFADLALVFPVKELTSELPAFGKEQESYLNEECWKYLNESERDFLMRASVFTKPLTFDALKVCRKEPSKVLKSLAERFYMIKRGEDYYIHDIIKDFALSKLSETKRLYVEAQRRAAGYYEKSLSAENLLLIYHHLMEAGDRKRAVDSINGNIDHFWREGYWSDVRGVLEESLDLFKDEKMIADISFSLGTIIHRLAEWNKAIGWDKAIEYYEKDLKISEKLGDAEGMASTCNNLGSVYYKKGEMDKAIDYYKKSLEIFEKLGDAQNMALAKYGIANILSDKEKFDEALELYFESESILEKLGDKFNLMNVYYNIADCYEDMNQKEKAGEYFQKSRELRNQLR